MIAVKHRFHGHGSLRYVYQNGQTVRGQLIALRYIVNNRRKAHRLAVVVSKKISKSAVVRNRIRRRIYEIVRSNQDKINGPYDLVITVFNVQCSDMEYKELEQQILAQFKQAGVIS